MGTGAERLAGIDGHVQRRLAGRLPRRAHGQAVAEDERPVKRPPALGPVIGDLLGADVDQGSAGGRPEVGQLRQLAGRPVDGVLDDIAADRHLLDPAGRQLEELGEYHLGLRAVDPDGEPDHRGAGATRRRRA